MYDNHCIMVIKCGRGTGVTVGRASDITEVSKEWGILPFNKSGPFSERGDSGGRGQIGGLPTGGVGSHMVTTEITYITPISLVMEIIHNDRSFVSAYHEVGQPA